MKVTLGSTNLSDYTNALRKSLVKHKVLAEHYVYEEGLRGPITDSFVRSRMPKGAEPFDKNGNLTPLGMVQLNRSLFYHNVPREATMEDLFDAMAKNMR